MKPLEIMRETESYFFVTTISGVVLGGGLNSLSLFGCFPFALGSNDRLPRHGALAGDFPGYYPVVPESIHLYFVLAGIPLWILLIVNPNK